MGKIIFNIGFVGYLKLRKSQEVTTRLTFHLQTSLPLGSHNKWNAKEWHGTGGIRARNFFPHIAGFPFHSFPFLQCNATNNSEITTHSRFLPAWPAAACFFRGNSTKGSIQIRIPRDRQFPSHGQTFKRRPTEPHSLKQYISWCRGGI